MTEKNEKRLSMRQQFRAKALEQLDDIISEAHKAIQAVATKHSVDLIDLVKAIGESSSKTADHNLVTQLANAAEDAAVKLWNNQQKLELGEKHGDK